MTPEELNTGTRLLEDIGLLEVVGQVTIPPNDTGQIGDTIKNKAQGNATYGYFNADDEEEGQVFDLVLWLLNHAQELVNLARLEHDAPKAYADALDLRNNNWVCSHNPDRNVVMSLNNEGEKIVSAMTWHMLLALELAFRAGASSNDSAYD